MRYFIIGMLTILLQLGLSGQTPSISGETIVCPGDIEYYQIIDERCTSFTDSEWNITNGTELFFGVVEAREVQWHDSGENSGTVSVSYVCLSSPDSDPIVVEDLSLEVEIRQIQVPFFDEDFVEIPLEDNSLFTISTPNQGDNFIYSWSFPECLPGSDGLYYTTVTPDLYGIGTICLTVYDNQCGKSVTECIEIKRSCEIARTYTSSGELPSFTSMEENISTDGEVLTILPYVEFKAGVDIILNPGFEANEDFLAHIGECGRSPEAEGCIGLGTSGLISKNDLDSDKKALSPYYGKEHEMEIKSPRFNNDFKMKILPNPASDNLTITIDDFNPNQDIAFEILDLNGRLLLRGPIHDQKTFVDINMLNKGIYIVKVFMSNHQSFERLVKY